MKIAAPINAAMPAVEKPATGATIATHWIARHLHRQGQAFGLQLPDDELPPGADIEHRDLALFGLGRGEHHA